MPDPRARLTFALADDVTPAEFAEILTALETIHREITGRPLQDLHVERGAASSRCPSCGGASLDITTMDDAARRIRQFICGNLSSEPCQTIIGGRRWTTGPDEIGPRVESPEEHERTLTTLLEFVKGLGATHEAQAKDYDTHDPVWSRHDGAVDACDEIAQKIDNLLREKSAGSFPQ